MKGSVRPVKAWSWEAINQCKGGLLSCAMLRQAQHKFTTESWHEITTLIPGLKLMRQDLFVQVPSGNIIICGHFPPVDARFFISLIVFWRESGSSRFTYTGWVNSISAAENIVYFNKHIITNWQITVKILITAHALINIHPQFGLEKWPVFWQILEKYQPLINTNWRILVEKDYDVSFWICCLML